MERPLFELYREAQTVFHGWVSDGKFGATSASLFEEERCCEFLPHLWGLSDQQLRNGLTEEMRPTFEALLGPNGWAIYKMMEARKLND